MTYLTLTATNSPEHRHQTSKDIGASRAFMPLALEREMEETRRALRWRRTLLRLADVLQDAAAHSHELAAILNEAFEHAMQHLLVHGNEQDLLSLESWLDEHQQEAVPA